MHNILCFKYAVLNINILEMEHNAFHIIHSFTNGGIVSAIGD